jgi:hypothetical protein
MQYPVFQGVEDEDIPSRQQTYLLSSRGVREAADIDTKRLGLIWGGCCCPLLRDRFATAAKASDVSRNGPGHNDLLMSSLGKIDSQHHIQRHAFFCAGGPDDLPSKLGPVDTILDTTNRRHLGLWWPAGKLPIP